MSTIFRTLVFLATSLLTPPPDAPFDEALAKEKKYVIFGEVLAADGKKPLEGVVMTISVGEGSLRPAETTKTDKDGKYRLVFRGGFGSGGVAIVHAGKPGWHAWPYGRSATFMLSDKPLVQEGRFVHTTNLMPGDPSWLQFRMQPAASLKFTLTDAAGKPMAKTRVWLTGENLPAGGSVIADVRTDAAGVVTVSDVPRSRYRLVMQRDNSRDELELGSIDFRDAAEYVATATIHEWTGTGSHVTFKATRGQNR